MEYNLQTEYKEITPLLLLLLLPSTASCPLDPFNVVKSTAAHPWLPIIITNIYWSRKKAYFTLVQYDAQDKPISSPFSVSK